jgi:hypothetical protein
MIAGFFIFGAGILFIFTEKDREPSIDGNMATQNK